MRRSQRIRGPPKDVFAKEFVGEQWEKLCHNNGDKDLKEEISREMNKFELPIVANHQRGNRTPGGGSTISRSAAARLSFEELTILENTIGPTALARRKSMENVLNGREIEASILKGGGRNDNQTIGTSGHLSEMIRASFDPSASNLVEASNVLPENIGSLMARSGGDDLKNQLIQTSLNADLSKEHLYCAEKEKSEARALSSSEGVEGESFFVSKDAVVVVPEEFPALPKTKESDFGYISQKRNVQNPVGEGGASWAKIVAPNRDRSAGTSLEFIPAVKDDNGRNCVKYVKEDVESEIQRWQFAVVFYVLGSKPTFNAMKGFTYRKWRKFGEFELFMLKTGVFIASFQDEEAQAQVLDLGPWCFDNRPLIVKPWSTEVSLDKEDIAEIPIWIKLPGLKLHLWSNTMLSRIASVVGKPLFTDRMTAKRERLTYARVCVEINVDCELPDVIPIYDSDGNMTRQVIEYEWAPAKCGRCKIFGHKGENCPKLSRVTKQWVPKKEELGNKATAEDNQILEDQSDQDMSGQLRRECVPKEIGIVSEVENTIEEKSKDEVVPITRDRKEAKGKYIVEDQTDVSNSRGVKPTGAQIIPVVNSFAVLQKELDYNLEDVDSIISKTKGAGPSGNIKQGGGGKSNGKARSRKK